MDHKETLPKTEVFKIRRVEEQIALMQSYRQPFSFQTSGGAHYGAVRNWIQCKAVNGDSVTWGSQDEVRLSYNLTVSLLEDLACTIASAAVNEFKGLR